MSNLWQVRYCANEALSNVRRHPGPSLVAVSSIAVLLFLAGLGAWMWMSFELVASGWKEKARLIVYLRDDVAQGQKEAVSQALAGHKEVQDVRFVSRAEAMRKMRESLDGQHDLLDGFEESPLPASFEVTLKPDSRRVVSLDKVAQDVAGLPGVDDVEYSRPLLVKLDAISATGRAAGLVAVVLLGAAMVLIINNTSKLSIYARLEEVEIFKLVGATPFLIRGPYVMEGALMGIAGGVLSGTALVILQALVGAWYGADLKAAFGLWPSLSLAWLIAGCATGVGLALGVAGGVNAARNIVKRLP